MNNFAQLISEARKAGIVTPEEHNRRHAQALKQSPSVKKLSFKEFNRKIGNPWSRILDKRVDVTDYQVEYHESINKYNKILVNKTKKGGFTDGFLRHCSQESFDRYAGHECILMAGNTGAIALDVVERLNTIFEEKDGFTDYDGKHWRYGDLVLKITKHPNVVLELYNGTKYIGTPASKSGKSVNIRGYSDVVMWFLTEAAHTGAIDDYPVLNGLTSLTANRDFGHQIEETTPNGKRGFFYDQWADATGPELKNYFTKAKSGWYTLQYDYTVAVKEGVISERFIEEQKKDKRVDFAQEYMCAFTTSKNNAFEKLKPENFTEREAIALD